MKRTTDTRDEIMTIKPDKQRRTENQIYDVAMDCFGEEFEVTPSALAEDQLDNTGHIVGQVFMLWPMSNETRKVQLKLMSDSLDLVFQGPGLEKLDFLTKDKVKVSLKGGKKEDKKAGSPHTLPFKLVFSNGALVKFLASEKRQEEKVVDLFQDAEQDKNLAEDDWFSPPSAPPDAIRGHRKIPSEPNSPVVALPEPDGITSRVSDPDLSNNLSPEHEDNNKPSAYYIHHISPIHPEGVYSSVGKVSATFDPILRSSSHMSASPPVPGPKSVHAPQIKVKRIRKIDTRHPRSSHGSTTSDVMTTTDSREPNVHKLQGKKAKKKKQAALARIGRERAKQGPPSPPRPQRDPALDMVAGFRSERGGTYTPLGNVTPGANYCLVGVVADAGPIKRTKTGDLSKSCVLVDPSPSGYQSLTVNVFVAEMDGHLLPSVKSGQILLFRNIKCKEFNGKMQGTGYKDSFQWCGYDPTEGKHFYTVSSSQSNQSTFFDPSADEMKYFVKLADWWRALKEAEEKAQLSMNDPSNGSTSYIVLPKPRRQKLQVISQFEPGTFVDCVVELLKVWKNDPSSDLYVTDYSENKYLQHQTTLDASLFGRRILKISVWDESNAMVDDLEPQSFYLLKNLRLKKLEGSRTILEGHMGYSERGIYRLGLGSDQQNLKELFSRKEEYERDPRHSKFEPEEENSSVGEPIQQGHDTPLSLPVDPESFHIMRCFYMDQTLSTIKEVLQNNRCPNKFRVRARITEYYPWRVEDFVTVECTDCQKILDASHNLCPECGDLAGKSISARYQFALQIADESGEVLNVNVSDNDADELLAGLDPKDAREDAVTLKRRLGPLIGHLESWHSEFDEGMKAKGPLLDICVSSWVSEVVEGGESTRSYKLFGCKLQL